MMGVFSGCALVERDSVGALCARDGGFVGRYDRIVRGLGVHIE
jgi:hypothetical protein